MGHVERNHPSSLPLVSMLVEKLRPQNIQLIYISSYSAQDVYSVQMCTDCCFFGAVIGALLVIELMKIRSPWEPKNLEMIKPNNLSLSDWYGQIRDTGEGKSGQVEAPQVPQCVVGKSQDGIRHEKSSYTVYGDHLWVWYGGEFLSEMIGHGFYHFSVIGATVACQGYGFDA